MGGPHPSPCLPLPPPTPQCASPPVRALKPGAPPPASVRAATHMRRQLVASCSLLLLTLFFSFGTVGPSGALTAAALTSAVFLGQP